MFILNVALNWHLDRKGQIAFLANLVKSCFMKNMFSIKNVPSAVLLSYHQYHIISFVSSVFLRRINFLFSKGILYKEFYRERQIVKSNY